MKRSQDVLRATFDEIATVMRARFAGQKVQLDHRGLKGRAREVTLAAEYLEQYLPKNVQLRRNIEVVSTDGQVSPECDLVISDARTPPLWVAGDIEVMPIECVYAVIEVKSHLSAKELDDAWNKIRTIKAMPKTAWYPDNSAFKTMVKMYGRQLPYMPVAGLVFAYEGAGLEGLAQKLFSRASEDMVTPQHSIDGVYVLNDGALIWGSSGEDWVTAMPGKRTVRIVEPPQDHSVLPMMTLHVQRLMALAHMPRFDFGAYMEDMHFGSTKELTDEEDAGFPTEAP